MTETPKSFSEDEGWAEAKNRGCEVKPNVYLENLLIQMALLIRGFDNPRIIKCEKTADIVGEIINLF